MKTWILSILVAATTITACNSNDNSAEKVSQTNETDTTATTHTNHTAEKPPTAVNEVVTAYLHLKDALANDNGNEAATAGKQLKEALQKLDESSLTAEQKNVYAEVKEDMTEHAEHISDNAGNIAHQREHFDMLSQSMYDLVKAVGTNQTLYKEFCPMYNDDKGAFWLSESKEIKNPYFGKKMLTCGEVQEEINKP